jgi:hypothetical protein
MRALPRLALLAAALSLAGCGAGSGICDCKPDTQVCIRGRCFDNAVCAARDPQPSAFPVCAAGASASCAQPKGVQPVGRRVFFDVPAGATSITIQLQAFSSPDVPPPVTQIRARDRDGTFALPNTAVPLTVRAPGDVLWFDDAAEVAEDPPARLVYVPGASSSPVVGSLTIPNTTRALETAAAGLPAGSWELVVSDYAYECASVPRLSDFCGRGAGASTADLERYAAGAYDVTVVVEAGAPATVSPMDVAFYLQRCAGADVDAQGRCATPLTAGAAPADADVQRMVAGVRQLLGNAGITVGEVSFRDLPPDAQVRWARGLDLDAAACDVQLGQLLALAEPGNRMNLFLLPEIVARSESGDATETVGIDGTIPGPAGLGGTVQSGAVVSASDLRFRATAESCSGAFSYSGCGADRLAYIAAHETGHFLGLYHTTERTGSIFDPLVDTPACPCAACGGARCDTADASVGRASCSAGPACGGADNLMFWVVGDGSQGNLTPQQAGVMRASPLVR